MLSRDIRRAFLQFFQKNDHLFVPSASTVPNHDPSLLFTSAGMVPFKDYFLGLTTPPHNALTSAQKCVRAGGKHNDLDCVGYTKRHHTFFEMLGNFAFGKYFKEQAISYGWDFLIKQLQLDASKVSVTYYHTDEETRELWRKFLPDNKIIPINTSDNFWSMGATGPCGPCTEIFYDFSSMINDPNASEEDRIVEIWNLVFMQFNALEDGSLKPLDIPCVDTGMGLERLACILQSTDDNYRTDVLAHIKSSTEDLLSISITPENTPAFNVIADHVRCATFLIGDGVFPSNIGRGYVLRKILRRAMRYAHKLNASSTTSFLHTLSRSVVDKMGEDFPDITTHQKLIQQTIQQEEERFGDILHNGLRVFDQEVSSLSSSTFPAKVVFDLYDTYGFPLDVTYELLRNNNFSVDESQVNALIEKQREASKKTWKGSGDSTASDIWKSLGKELPTTRFTGYHNDSGSGTVVAIIKDGCPVSALEPTDEGWLITDQTPFYAESGGQVGDKGLIQIGQSCFQVVDTQKPVSGLFAHWGKVSSGTIVQNGKVDLTIDKIHRQRTEAHHTATHLLHKALHTRFSSTTVQKGSLVCADYLRFDFHLPQTISEEDILFLEQWVNHHIVLNARVKAEEFSQEEARSMGAIGLFGEKYGDTVRVVSIGDEVFFSREFCGGCHVNYTGEIGLFHIISHQSIGSDTKRITACVGQSFAQKAREYKDTITNIQNALGVGQKEIMDRIQSIIQSGKKKSHRQQQGEEMVESLGQNSLKIISFVGADMSHLRRCVDSSRTQHQLITCATNIDEDQKISIIIGISDDLKDSISAVPLVRMMSQKISPSENGGGRSNFAQCGGNNPKGLSSALDSLRTMLKS